MANAKQELLDHVGDREIKCVDISHGHDYDENPKNIILPLDYTDEDMLSFLKELDFEYHDGFGGQELFGIIWYKDGTWSERREYDGSEWWEHNTCPNIPDYLIKQLTSSNNTNMETYIYAVGYGEFMKQVNKGWGCGYIMIPLEHEFLKQESVVNDGSYTTQIPDFEEEITYEKNKEFNGVTYKVLGFDLAHSWNGAEHDFDFCLSRTIQMKSIVDSYNK